ncbi:MAG: GerMN domain-containing protein [bacterium]
MIRRLGAAGNHGLIKQFLLIILSLIIAGFGFWLWTEVKTPGQKIKRNQLLSRILQETAGKDKEKDLTVLQLYFAKRTHFALAIETREVELERSTPVQQKVNRTLCELIKGPMHDDLAPTIPVGTKLRSFFLDKNGIGYADFSKEMIKNHPGGTWAELISIYSIVNTVTNNFPQVNQVKLLIDGLEVETLRGHLDIRRGFSFNDTLTRPPQQ